MVAPAGTAGRRGTAVGVPGDTGRAVLTQGWLQPGYSEERSPPCWACGAGAVPAAGLTAPELL